MGKNCAYKQVNAAVWMKTLLVIWLLGCQGMSFPLAAQTSWRDSLSTLNRQIALSPRSTDLRLRKAAVNIELGQWDYAIEEYGRVLDIDADNPAALYFRAYAYLHQRLPQMAQRDYERFLMRSPRHFEARIGLAMAKRQLGRSTDAMDQLNLLVEQYPDSAVVFAARADYEAELKLYDAALFDWDEALRLQPRNVSFVGAKIELLCTLRRYDEARHTIGEALQRGVPTAALKHWTDQLK